MTYGRAELLRAIRGLAEIDSRPEDPSEVALAFEVAMLEVARARYACLTKSETDAAKRLDAELEPLGLQNERPDLWTREAVATERVWHELRAVAGEALLVFEAA